VQKDDLTIAFEKNRVEQIIYYFNTIGVYSVIAFIGGFFILDLFYADSRATLYRWALYRGVMVAIVVAFGQIFKRVDWSYKTVSTIVLLLGVALCTISNMAILESGGLNSEYMWGSVVVAVGMVIIMEPGLKETAILVLACLLPLFLSPYIVPDETLTPELMAIRLANPVIVCIFLLLRSFRSHSQIMDFLKQQIDAKLATSIAQMTQMVAHDIRTPLIQTKNLLILMNQDPDLSKNELLVSCNSQINRKIENVEEILNDILLSRPIVKKAKISAQELVNQAWLDATLRHNIKKYTLDIDAKGIMYVDPLKFKRVIENIFRNAIEAMPDGGTVSVKAITEEGQVGFLSISNNGPKISESELTTLFDPHYTSGKSNGHGLGLAISKKIVEDHGGSIAVDSDECLTRFVIRLPIESKDEKNGGGRRR
jgi:signal transduction histidine kinase